MNLIIVESPTKAKTLNRFLGSDYEVLATKGHIKDLPKSKLGVDTDNNFEPTFEVVAKQAATIKALVQAGKKATNIFLATDPDREGEAISAHVREILVEDKKTSVKPMKRIVFHEITKSAVEHAISEPREVDSHLVDAQTARRVLDRLVGYKVSPLLWKKVRVGLSAGRVQSVAVRLIVEREREIEAFKPEEYWEIGSEVSAAGHNFLVSLVKVQDGKAEIHDGETAGKIVTDLNAAEYSVSDVKKREVHKKAYPPFTTSTMSQAAARMFGWSAKRTMTIAQKLYEQGVITYHRTDSVNLSKEAVAAVRELISKEFGKEYLPKGEALFKKQSKMAQEAHEAIRPTNVKELMQTVSDSAEEQKLYSLIWKRFVACQMAEAVYDETSIEVAAKGSALSGRHYLLRASGQILKFEGWRRLFPQKTNEDGVVLLPPVNTSDHLDLIKVLSEQKFTQPPARYNEASIIKTLEKLGIGRPSTYAPTISTIQARGYIEKNEGKFSPTSVGIAVNDFLIKNFTDVF
ncbi:type I DNA topoisomerase, partial [Candidatus Woesebacteria bacterium]|nr:type I DNA topoisomerase [Candidatus Woesebacteria bacterium]